MKIKIKYHNQNCKIQSFGDWIDLRASEDMEFTAPFKDRHHQIQFDYKLIPLGISMQLPKYFEANIAPRSSTFKNFGLISANHLGIVDNSYCGDGDIWQFPAIALRESKIKEGDRICQFRIRPSQNAPIWVKLRWLFTNKITFQEVKELGNKNRGGFGSTSVK